MQKIKAKEKSEKKYMKTANRCNSKESHTLNRKSIALLSKEEIMSIY